jgi:hypothetical protein
MPHTTLLKFTFQYDEQSMMPLIPVNFFYRDGTPTQPFQDAVLDSGANQITNPKAHRRQTTMKNTTIKK